jgi:hypothetical protein
MTISHVLNTGFHQFHPHVDGKPATDKGSDDGEHDVHGANVFVVGGIQPTLYKPRWGPVMIV